MTFGLSDLVRGLVVLSVHSRQAEVAPGAAKAFGFSIPAGVLSIVDEVIESMTDVCFWLPISDIDHGWRLSGKGEEGWCHA